MCSISPSRQSQIPSGSHTYSSGIPANQNQSISLVAANGIITLVISNAWLNHTSSWGSWFRRAASKLIAVALAGLFEQSMIYITLHILTRIDNRLTSVRIIFSRLSRLPDLAPPASVAERVYVASPDTPLPQKIFPFSTCLSALKFSTKVTDAQRNLQPKITKYACILHTTMYESNVWERIFCPKRFHLVKNVGNFL